MTRTVKGKRKWFNPRKSTDWIILGILVIFALVFIAIIIPVDAISREDITKTKSQIKELENQILNYDNKISSQRITIQSNETNLDKAKEEIRKQRAALNDSYTAFEALEKAKQNVIEAEKTLEQSRQKLQQLINEKNQVKASLTKLKNQLQTDETQIRKQNQPDLSNYPRLIGITLSQSCITMIKNNISSTCPDPQELVWLDTSNTRISGEFAYIDGILQRNKTNIKNSYNWYQYDNQIRIIYDPPFDTAQRIQMIEIRPNFDVYYLRNEMSISDENTDFARVLYHHRYIDSCKYAIIDSSLYKSLLPDTIYHMRLGCTPNSTQFIEKEIIYPEYTDFDITTSSWYKYSVWLDNVTKHCIFKYKACQN